MARVFPAGLVSAYLQAIFAVLITWVFLLIARLIGPKDALLLHDGPSDAAAQWMVQHLVDLRYCLLLCAITTVIVAGRYSSSCWDRVRREAERISPITPRKELQAIFAQLTVTAVCFGISTLQPAPHVLVAMLRPLGPSLMSTARWSGLASTATAFLGASAVSAYHAKKLY